MGIAFIITHQWRFSFYIGGLEFISKIGIFYFHERLWNTFSRPPWSIGKINLSAAKEYCRNNFFNFLGSVAHSFKKALYSANKSQDVEAE